jgi:hypothetical protein
MGTNPNWVCIAGKRTTDMLPPISALPEPLELCRNTFPAD